MFLKFIDGSIYVRRIADGREVFKVYRRGRKGSQKAAVPAAPNEKSRYVTRGYPIACGGSAISIASVTFPSGL